MSDNAAITTILSTLIAAVTIIVTTALLKGWKPWA